MAGTTGTTSFADPRICDMAARQLAHLFPRRYAFDLGATLLERDRQRLECLNVWRRAHGLDPVVAPERPSVVRASAASVQPLIALVIEGRGQARSRALSELESLGLPALPAVREALARPSADGAARDALGALARRLSIIVREVTVTPTAIPLGDAIAARVHTLEKRPLTSGSVVDLLVTFALETPTGTAGVRLTLDRPADDTGVAIGIALVANEVGATGSGLGWSDSQSGAIGEKLILGSGGSCIPEYPRHADYWFMLAHALDEAIASPADASFSFRVTLIRER